MTEAAEIAAVLWPTAAEELVLDIAVGPEDRVATAFATWRQAVDLEAYFAYSTFRLLPLIYHRLHALGMTDPILGILRGVYRKSWCEAQATTFALAPVVAALEKRGLRTMLLKGAVLRQEYYRNAALRPMSDLDVVVEPGNAAAAVSLLRDMQWVRNETARDEDFVYRHSQLLRDASGREIDLHWHLMPEACSADASAMLWAAARPLDFGGVSTLQPGPTDMLLHTVIHGLRANRMPPLRWIADAITVLRVAGPEIDWDAFLNRAAALRLNVRLGLGLGYLARRFAAPILPEVLAVLKRRRPSWVERVENSVVLRDTDRLYRRVATKPWVMFAEYARISRDTNPIRFIDGFSHYIRYRALARGRWQVAADVLGGLTRRIRRTLIAQ